MKNKVKNTIIKLLNEVSEKTTTVKSGVITYRYKFTVNNENFIVLLRQMSDWEEWGVPFNRYEASFYHEKDENNPAKYYSSFSFSPSMVKNIIFNFYDKIYDFMEEQDDETIIYIDPVHKDLEKENKLGKIYIFLLEKHKLKNFFEKEIYQKRNLILINTHKNIN